MVKLIMRKKILQSTPSELSIHQPQPPLTGRRTQYLLNSPLSAETKQVLISKLGVDNYNLLQKQGYICFDFFNHAAVTRYLKNNAKSFVLHKKNRCNEIDLTRNEKNQVTKSTIVNTENGTQRKIMYRPAELTINELLATLKTKQNNPPTSTKPSIVSEKRQELINVSGNNLYNYLDKNGHVRFDILEENSAETYLQDNNKSFVLRGNSQDSDAFLTIYYGAFSNSSFAHYKLRTSYDWNDAVNLMYDCTTSELKQQSDTQNPSPPSQNTKGLGTFALLPISVVEQVLVPYLGFTSLFTVAQTNKLMYSTIMKVVKNPLSKEIEIQTYQALTSQNPEEINQSHVGRMMHTSALFCAARASAKHYGGELVTDRYFYIQAAYSSQVAEFDNEGVIIRQFPTDVRKLDLTRLIVRKQVFTGVPGVKYTCIPPYEQRLFTHGDKVGTSTKKNGGNHISATKLSTKIDDLKQELKEKIGVDDYSFLEKNGYIQLDRSSGCRAAEHFFLSNAKDFMLRRRSDTHPTLTLSVYDYKSSEIKHYFFDSEKNGDIALKILRELIKKALATEKNSFSL